MPTLQGIAVNLVSTARGTLTEYTLADDEPTSPFESSCYIEAVSDEEFTLSIDSSSYSPTNPEIIRFRIFLCIDATVHGLDSPLGSLRFAEVGKRSTCTGFLKKRADGHLYETAFSFAKLDVTEDGTFEMPTDRHLAQRGVFEIRVCRMRKVGERQYQVPPLRHRSGTEVLEAETADRTAKLVHENDLKGMDIQHRIGSGKTRVVTSNPSKWILRELDTIQNPFLTFKFLYRSQNALKSLGMIPRTPSPSPSEAQAAVAAQLSSLSRDDLVTQILELRMAQESLTRGVKRERPDDTTDSPPRSRRKKDPVMIDLT